MNLFNLALNFRTARIVRVEIELSGISIRIPARTWTAPSWCAIFSYPSEMKEFLVSHWE